MGGVLYLGGLIINVSTDEAVAERLSQTDMAQDAGNDRLIHLTNNISRSSLDPCLLHSYRRL